VLPQELIQRLFLPLPAEPEWLPAFQIAHYRQKLWAMTGIGQYRKTFGFGTMSGIIVSLTLQASIDGHVVMSTHIDPCKTCARRILGPQAEAIFRTPAPRTFTSGWTQFWAQYRKRDSHRR
jgi:hypothetical protein